MKCKVKAKAMINPTEDLEKVTEALSNMFDYDDIEIGEDYVLVSGGIESLQILKELLRERRIRDTATRILEKGVHDTKITFSLSKQAALVGVSNFVDGYLSPLGEIEVEIETDEVEALIQWITEK
ncbi:RNA-binding domain-containing protein [Methanobacterium aggregans]|uniref:RNA-binding domain-containing protein n=1 Tax=Methanobacterium aggregans TaxID=1615586 RepID=UPI001AEB5873|nr:RNA-binding domain-containing protein [Methanobacterium aggregans]MBP2045230.1 putative RNA binding protein with dsRBD fold (UPF0201 family) [Methanobacterium aggregans]